MKTKAVLFDLDGTLLPMDQDLFVKTYFGLLAARLAPHGYEPKRLIDAIWSGTAAMINNTGAKRNEEVFWDEFAALWGEKSREDLPLFQDFYEHEFDGARKVCGYTAQAAAVVAQVKNMGLRVVLATNPIFPAVATQKRIRWAGLAPEDFEWYTTYENSNYSKPNPKYYMEIVRRLGIAPEECVMVGNDVGDDMVARELGMKVFLLTDCLINPRGADISAFPHGDFSRLSEFLDGLAGQEG